jgi:transcriptional regulator with XRE-family HTH domain
MMAERMMGLTRMREAKGMGVYVRQRRYELKLAQRELAERVGVSEATISRIESGERGSQMPYDTLKNLAAALGHSVEDFLANAEASLDTEQEVNGRTPGVAASGRTSPPIS